MFDLAFADQVLNGARYVFHRHVWIDAVLIKEVDAVGVQSLEALEQLHRKPLVRVLERYAPTVPGFFLYFPSLARRSAPLRLFVEAAKELSLRVMK